MREFAIDLAHRAGEILMEYQRRGLLSHEIRSKQNQADLVTAADLAAERLITQAIRERHPEHGIHAEESAGGELPAADWVWLVDPVDGTTNFAHGVPLFAVNLAVAHAGVPVLGVTFDPSSSRTYWAEQDGGTWLRVNGHDMRLKVSATTTLAGCLFATGFPAYRRMNPDNNLAEFSALEHRIHGVRRLGTAALELAWVAAGILEGYWEAGLKPWDWAAGWLLVVEAGGRVTDYAGAPWRLGSRTLIASNGQPAVHPEFQRAIAAARTAAGFDR